MSLPDTIFIFALALIIFGPKKLPEIGRQIGKLVGEFRRASNEFKFQIEEELRQVDFAEKRQTIAAPKNETLAASTISETAEAEDNIPVGQHPNIDNLDVSTLNEFPAESGDMELTGDSEGVSSSSSMPATEPTITAAPGSLPRTTHPYAPAEPMADRTTETSIPVESSGPATPDEANLTPDPEHAEVTHG